MFCCVVFCCVVSVDDELFVEAVDVLLAEDFFFAFLALGSALRAGSVPPTSTPATAAGGATLDALGLDAGAGGLGLRATGLGQPEGGRERGDDGHEADGEGTGFHGEELYFLARRARCESAG